MLHRFKQRFYPNWVLRKACEKVDEVNRDSLLFDNTPTKDSNVDKIRLITTYNQKSKNVSKLLEKNWPIMHTLIHSLSG